jgi:hypothetical protein
VPHANLFLQCRTCSRLTGGAALAFLQTPASRSTRCAACRWPTTRTA